jgi:outer membrane protein assembly factor BamA
MRQKLAKKLRMDVALALYVGDDVTAEDVKKDRKTVFASSDFKPVIQSKEKEPQAQRTGREKH